MPAWESSISHSLEQLLKLMTHCQARRAIRCNKQAVIYLQRRRRSFMASGGAQVMRAHGSQGVSELIVLSLPPDPLFVSVRSPAHFFLYYISVQLRVVGAADSGLHRAVCWKRRRKTTCQGSEVKGQLEATGCGTGLQAAQLTHTQSVNEHFASSLKWSVRWRY